MFYAQCSSKNIDRLLRHFDKLSGVQLTSTSSVHRSALLCYMLYLYLHRESKIHLYRKNWEIFFRGR